MTRSIVYIEVIWKILYGSTNAALTRGQRVSVLVGARRFIAAWGLKRQRSNEAAAFAIDDFVLLFPLGTGKCAAKSLGSRNVFLTNAFNV